LTRRAKGEGSIYQRHDHESCPPAIDGERPDHRCRGRWVATISYPSDTGRRDRKVIYGKTKTEVILKRKDAEKKAPAKRVRADKSHTVETWMNEWLEEIAAPDLKPQTLTSHRSKIKNYIVPLIGMHRLDRLEPKHIRRMYARMQEPCPRPDKDGKCIHSPSHGLSEATARQAHVILARALKIAVQEKLILEAETSNIKPPGTATKMRDSLSIEQAELVLATAVANKDAHASRWFAALHMGLRQGEARALPWGMVNFDEGSITIARTAYDDGTYGPPKSEAGNRTILMFPEFRAHLMVHYATYLAKCREQGREPNPLDLVWAQESGKIIGKKVDYNRWQKLLASAGCPAVSVHSARQSAAQRLERLGWPERVAAEFLGHSDVKQTYKYQRGHSLDSQRRAMGELES
jgi:integrase